MIHFDDLYVLLYFLYINDFKKIYQLLKFLYFLKYAKILDSTII